MAEMTIMRHMRLDVAMPGSQQVLYARRGDARVYALTIDLCERSAPLPLPEHWTAVLRASKPDGTKLLLPASVEQERVRVYLGGQALTAEGIVKCQVELYGPAENLLYSPSFDICVEPLVLGDDEIESSDDFGALEEALKEVTQLKDEVEELGSQMGQAMEDCQEATGDAELAAEKIENLTLGMTMLPASEEPGVVVEQGESSIHAQLFVPYARIAIPVIEVDDHMDVYITTPEGWEDISFEAVNGDLEVVLNG